MIEPEALIIVHYHLLPGGVTSAMALGIKALVRCGWLAGRRVIFLAGRTQGVDGFHHRLAQLGVEAEIQVDRRLDYQDGPWPAAAMFQQEANSLAAWLLARGDGPRVYWAHNPTLGKNPLLTAALLQAARQAAAESDPSRFLFHLHDFPECGRLPNLQNLRRCWGAGGLEDLYPKEGNVAFGVLTRADGARMQRAGVGSQRIFYLPNAVEAGGDAEGGQRDQIAARLATYAAAHGYRFEPEWPWWVMPIRLIRRKNVLEAVLLAAMQEQPHQLLITLDANSAPERPYAEAVKDLVRRLQLPVVVGFGHTLVGKAFGLLDLLGAAEAAVTTSLMEGFGFTFVDGPNHGVPLIGRDLPDVTADFAAAGFPAGRLYRELRVPITMGARQRLLRWAQGYAGSLRRNFGLPASLEERFVAEIEARLQPEAVDFAALDLAAQVEVIQRLDDQSFLGKVREANQPLPRPLTMPPTFRRQLQERFGLETHGRRLREAFASLFSLPSEENAAINVSQGLLVEFFWPRFHPPLLVGSMAE